MPSTTRTSSRDTTLRREADTNKDGNVDTYLTFEDGKKKTQEEDRDGDGNVDMFVTHWKPEENALYVHEQGTLFRDDSLATYLGPPGRGLSGSAGPSGAPGRWEVRAA